MWLCRLDAHERLFEVLLENVAIKTVPIKGLYVGEIEFGDYLELMVQEAKAERKRLEQQRRCGR